jgi:hypothetical protein
MAAFGRNNGQPRVPRTLRRLLCACLLLCGPTAQAGRLELGHIHGLAFAAGGERLLLAADVGIVAYRHGHWYRLPGPAQNYTAFTLTDDALYTSGHPAADRQQTHPIGLQKRRNGGTRWLSLGMKGEAAFHVMAAGYHQHILYVLNETPNRTLPLRGIYYTLNDGHIWHHTQARNAPPPVSLAIHPRRSGIVAIGSRDGLFLSMDHARSFRALDRRREIYAICFDFDGDHLFYAGQNVTPALIRMDIHGGGRSAIHSPALGDDTIAYIAQNPVARQQLALTTFKKDVYLSDDSGETWQKIADHGRGMEHGPGD